MRSRKLLCYRNLVPAVDDEVSPLIIFQHFVFLGGSYALAELCNPVRAFFADFCEPALVFLQQFVIFQAVELEFLVGAKLLDPPCGEFCKVFLPFHAASPIDIFQKASGGLPDWCLWCSQSPPDGAAKALRCGL